MRGSSWLNPGLFISPQTKLLDKENPACWSIMTYKDRPAVYCQPQMRETNQKQREVSSSDQDVGIQVSSCLNTIHLSSEGRGGETKSVKASRSLSRASLLPLSHKYGTLISSTQTMWNLLAPPFSSPPSQLFCCV